MFEYIFINILRDFNNTSMYLIGFVSGTYCDGWNCVNCFNKVDNEPARRDAAETTMERNPNAFSPKKLLAVHMVLEINS